MVDAADTPPKCSIQRRIAQRSMMGTIWHATARIATKYWRRQPYPLQITRLACFEAYDGACKKVAAKRAAHTERYRSNAAGVDSSRGRSDWRRIVRRLMIGFISRAIANSRNLTQSERFGQIGRQTIVRNVALCALCSRVICKRHALLRGLGTIVTLQCIKITAAAPSEDLRLMLEETMAAYPSRLRAAWGLADWERCQKPLPARDSSMDLLSVKPATRQVRG